MAELIIHSEKIKQNINYLSKYFESHNLQWSLVTKVFSGDKTFIKTILTKEVMEKISSVSDSRLSSLRNLREAFPTIPTICINPPAAVYADDVVECADISMNTSIATIQTLNDSAKKKNVIHKIIIMIELGELREGVNSNNALDFYEDVSRLSNIEVVGIGSNLGCMFGVEPDYDRLLVLSNIKKQIFKKFHKNLQLISGGTSITLPLLEKGLVPKENNHYRIGEAAFLGICPLEGKPFKDLNTDTFEFYANIVELNEKNVVPGEIFMDTSGGKIDYPKNNIPVKSYKAVLDFGLLDVDKNDLEADDKFSFVGTTSDMVVIDVGDNKSNYKVGDKIKFRLNYMALARLLNSKFIDKIYV